MSSLFTLLSSLLRPAVASQRATSPRRRTRLNLETLEDRRLLSGFHGGRLGEVEPVEIEHTPTMVGTAVVIRPVDDFGVHAVTVITPRQGEVELGDRQGEVEPGDRQGNGTRPVNATTVKVVQVKHHHRKRHHVGEHTLGHA
jgi:hypothetical protein